MDDKTIKFLLGGQLGHLRHREILGEDDFEFEKEIVYTGKSGITIVGHPDAIHKESGAIIEFKFSRHE